MSEWRFRISTRANRERCTPITTEQPKNQRFGLMKGVCGAHGTRCCVNARAVEHPHRCTRCKKIYFVVENRDERET